MKTIQIPKKSTNHCKFLFGIYRRARGAISRQINKIVI